MDHEVRAILRYIEFPSILPTTVGSSSSSNVILNCFDVLIPSLRLGSTCLPVTALETHPSHRHKYDILITTDPDETHEVAFEYSRSLKHYGHYTRVRSNVHDTDRSLSHRSSSFTQFVLSGKPTMYSKSSS